MSAYPVLVLGGYGTFGSKVCRALHRDPAVDVIVAGRDPAKAEHLVAALNQSRATNARACVLDFSSADFASQLKGTGARLLVHAAGPFQGQDYQVAEACLQAGIHYIDIADARAYVVGIGALDARAKQQGVTLISGASTVPGLSSAVINHLRPQFTSLDEIYYAVAPGNRTERGEATIAAILSYTGRPFQRWRTSAWRTAYGWQELERHLFPDPIGSRWLANCDIADLELFPRHYDGVQSVTFKAGLELSTLHLAMWAMSWLARLRLINNWAPHSGWITKMSRWFDSFGTDVGGMMVRLSGVGHDDKKLTVTWNLIAENGDGPEIPAMASTILAKRFARGEDLPPGAGPCLSLFTLEEFSREVSGRAIHHHVIRS